MSTKGDRAGSALASEETVIAERRDSGIIVLTLHAPQKRNALTEPLRHALVSELGTALSDPHCKAIVLTGGEGIFSAGGDISAMGQELDRAMDRLHLLHDVIKKMLRGPKPIVAAVSGPAYGAGWSLAMASDWVICDSSAKFSAAFARMGLIPDCGILWTLPRRIGEVNAKHYFAQANVVAAEDALEQGIVDELVQGDLLNAAVARAEALTLNAPLVLGEIKSHYADSSLDAALALESDAQRRLFQTNDHAEAVAAFRAKRPAKFHGQ